MEYILRYVTIGLTILLIGFIRIGYRVKILDRTIL